MWSQLNVASRRPARAVITSKRGSLGANHRTLSGGSRSLRPIGADTRMRGALARAEGCKKIWPWITGVFSAISLIRWGGAWLVIFCLQQEGEGGRGSRRESCGLPAPRQGGKCADVHLCVCRRLALCARSLLRRGLASGLWSLESSWAGRSWYKFVSARLASTLLPLSVCGRGG